MDHYTTLDPTFTTLLGAARTRLIEALRAATAADPEGATYSYAELGARVGVSARTIGRYLADGPTLDEALTAVELARRTRQVDRLGRLHLAKPALTALRNALLRLFIVARCQLYRLDPRTGELRRWKQTFAVRHDLPTLPARVLALLRPVPRDPSLTSLPCPVKMGAPFREQSTLPRERWLKAEANVIQAYAAIAAHPLQAVGLELHDRAPRSSLTRAARLLAGAAVPREQVGWLLEQARVLTWQNPGIALTRRTPDGALLLMPTFFRKLQQLTGGARNPAYVPDPSRRGIPIKGQVQRSPKKLRKVV